INSGSAGSISRERGQAAVISGRLNSKSTTLLTTASPSPRSLSNAGGSVAVLLPVGQQILAPPLSPILYDVIQDRPSPAEERPRTTPTGRPRDRPKTKAYVTLMTLVPEPLVFGPTGVKLRY